MGHASRFVLLLSLGANCLAGDLQPAGPNSMTNRDPIAVDGSLLDGPVPSPSPTRDWGVQFGVAIISQSNVGEIFAGERAEGRAGGQLYLLTVSRTVHRFGIPFFGHILTPEVDPYVTFTLVDENERAPFPDYNGGIGIRWVDFPWDRWIDMSLFVGVGLSYSAHVYTVDRQRHPGRERSHLKFDWPIQLTFALPRWPQHQLVLFNDHQSGGHIFDVGGVNSLGLGYRFEF